MAGRLVVEVAHGARVPQVADNYRCLASVRLRRAWGSDRRQGTDVPYLLDANIVMNAAFIRYGAADDFVKAATASSQQLLIDEATWLEGRAVLERKRVTLGLSFDPAAVMEEYWRKTKVLFVPPALDSDVPNHVNRKDRSVVTAAKIHAATLVTDDHPLLTEAGAAGVEAVTTVRALMLVGGADRLTASLDLHRSPQIPRPRHVAGHYVARVRLGEAAQAPNVRLTAFEQGGRLWTYYDTHLGAWVAEFDDDKRLLIKAPADLQIGAITTVCFTYMWATGPGKESRFVLRSGTRPAPSTPAKAGSLRSGWKRDEAGALHIGASSKGTDHLNGHVVNLTRGPGFISGDTWKALVGDASVLPSLYDADLLDAALSIYAGRRQFSSTPTIYDLL